MTSKQNRLKLNLALATMALFSSNVQSHGWSEFPNARQNICYEQGGIWSGSPPNVACANAKTISGTYPFVQRNEFSINVPDYNNINAVIAAIPDGTLCYGNDPQKRGMGAPSTAWERTDIGTGTFEYVFNATAPHNPSFWEFYLTKPGTDLSRGLAWNDLELIHTQGDVPVVGGKYRINVTIPSGRSGDAILFVRWQREDPVGEGFYNCSDITIAADSSPPPVVDPEPSAQLFRGDAFPPLGLEAPGIGDVVNYDIINRNGQVARNFEIEVNASNVNDWARLLASEINGWHRTFKNGAVFIGGWHAEMQHYMYFQNTPSRNYFNSRDARASGLMTITRQSSEVSGPLIGDIYELSASDNVVNAGDKVIIQTAESATLLQTQGTAVEIQNNGSTAIVVDTSAIVQNETLVFSAQSTSSQRAESFAFEVISGGTDIGTPAPTDGAWDPSRTYLGGETVSYGGRVWKAQWWVRGGSDPATVFGDDIWGVWRPEN
ncbi:MAG: lytic polysaccharide monooxygenase [Pseudomonadota bacterium]